MKMPEVQLAVRNIFLRRSLPTSNLTLAGGIEVSSNVDSFSEFCWASCDVSRIEENDEVDGHLILPNSSPAAAFVLDDEGRA